MTDIGGRNVGLSGMGHPKTGIPFTEKGAPIFDNVAVCDLRISREIASVKNRNLHATEATAQLNKLIESGVISKSHFSPDALLKIEKGSANIPGFVWHHHEDFSRMQLVPEWYHVKTGHDGMKFWPFTTGK
jgi:filamentous hemagglutinin